MTFIVILMALLIERFFDWSHLRRWRWFNAYAMWVARQFPALAPYALLATVVVPVLVLTLVCQGLLQGALFGLMTFVFQLALVLYCLGPVNLWADSFATVNVLTQGDAASATQKLNDWFSVNDVSDATTAQQYLLANMLIQANVRVFAVIVWYAFVGPLGVVFYRTVSRLTQGRDRRLSASASMVQACLDWFPVRLLSCLFALAGHFEQVFATLRRSLFSGIMQSDDLLMHCGQAALGHDVFAKATPGDGRVERSIIQLIDRALIILLVVVAIGVVLI